LCLGLGLTELLAVVSVDAPFIRGKPFYLILSPTLRVTVFSDVGKGISMFYVKIVGEAPKT